MIDNEIYKSLGEKWFTAKGDAIALLRIENETKAPWVLAQIRAHFHGEACRVLDVGSGGGFLTLKLADAGHACTALDVEESVMAAGRRRDPGGKIDWVVGRAERLPFPDASFEVVCVMDVLEHVRDSATVLREAARVLRPGGILLAHTFNRTPLAWLFAAKGLDWFLRDSPAHIHQWNMFIKPRELREVLFSLKMKITDLRGIHPVIFSRSFWRLVFTGRVDESFRFAIGGGLQVGYLVCAKNITVESWCRAVRASSGSPPLGPV